MFRIPRFRPWTSPKFSSFIFSRSPKIAIVGFAVACVGTGVLIPPRIHLDASTPADAPALTSSVVKDPATNIEFPATLRIPSRFPLPTYTLLGVGVRKVSIFSIKVYSIGFYADLDSVSPISRSATFDEKIRHVIETSSCVIRIVPTRSTSYSHLRDGFMRALQARIILQKSRHLLTPAEETQIVSPLLKFKSVFPTTPLAKGTPLDILLTPNRIFNGSDLKERELIVRDLGSISSNWLSQEFMLAYFEGDGISPPLKQSVEERLRDFGS